jgi:hypothetical protein
LSFHKKMFLLFYARVTFENLTNIGAKPLVKNCYSSCGRCWGRWICYYLGTTDLRSSLFTLHWWLPLVLLLTWGLFSPSHRESYQIEEVYTEQGKARSCLKFLLVLYVIKMKCRRLFKFHTVRILYILVYIYIYMKHY